VKCTLLINLQHTIELMLALILDVTSTKVITIKGNAVIYVGTLGSYSVTPLYDTRSCNSIIFADNLNLSSITFILMAMKKKNLR